MRPALALQCVARLVTGALITLATLDSAYALRTLHDFSGRPDDGAYPRANLIADSAGNLYGTTYGGGNGPQHHHCGTVFKLAPDGTETVLHSFVGNLNAEDGCNPTPDLVEDQSGNLYGTTEQGGAPEGCGTVFKVTPKGSESVLYAFCSNGNADGYSPMGGVILDQAGNLYGTTYAGGTGYAGTVFKVAPDGTEKILHDFSQGTSDGFGPAARLVADGNGHLYGTTVYGGVNGECADACGTVFVINTDGTNEKVLYSFDSMLNDAIYPHVPLFRDADGNLYGTATGGASGYGAVFKVALDGTETLLYSFPSTGNDGSCPCSGVTMDNAGDLYGTTVYGGNMGCSEGFGCGTIFKLATDGTETVLHRFQHREIGFRPAGSVVLTKKGALLGTTSKGKNCHPLHNCGTVFELLP